MNSIPIIKMLQKDGNKAIIGEPDLQKYLDLGWTIGWPEDEKPADEKPADEKPADEKPEDEKPAEKSEEVLPE